MNNEHVIDALNSLIVINNDRVEGYKTASDETKDTGLKALFAQFGQTSKQCRNELTSEVNRLGGKPDEGTRITGKFFRAWMDLKVALSANDRKVILSSCEYGEGVAAELYTSVLAKNKDTLSAEQQKMLHEQYTLIKADASKIASLKEFPEPVK